MPTLNLHQVHFKNNRRGAIEEGDGSWLLLMAEVMFTVNILDANKAEETDCDLLLQFLLIACYVRETCQARQGRCR